MDKKIFSFFVQNVRQINQMAFENAIKEKL